MADVSLNSAAASHAASLVAAGKIDDSKTWSAPSAEKADEYIATHSLSEFGKWNLGIHGDKPHGDKSHYGYPFSSDYDKISFRALRAIITRAAQAGAKAIEEKAQTLYDDAKKKLGKDKEKNETAVSRLCLRKATDRMLRNEVFVSASAAAGYTATDLFNWLKDECCDLTFPGQTGPCGYSWPVNIVMPAHEKGETWQAIVQGPKGCLYTVDFTLGDAGVTISGEPKEVVSKEQYVILDDLVEQASDEAAGRTEQDKKARGLKPGMKQRIFDLSPEQADEKDFTISVSFASEAPGIQRCGGYDGRDEPTEFERAAGLKSGQTYIEILDHDPASVDYSMLNNHGAVLDEHDEKDQIGVVQPGSARLDADARVSRCDLRMDDGEKGKMRFRQMKNMIRPHLSAGYKHSGYVGKQTMPDGRTGHRFKARFLEVTSCAVPMDPSIGVGRTYRTYAELPQVDSDYNSKSSDKPTEKGKSMTDDEKKAADAAEAQKLKDAESKGKREAKVEAETETVAKVKSATAGERERVKEIMKISSEFIKSRSDCEAKIRELTESSIASDISIDAFKMRAMEQILAAKAVQPVTMETLGFDDEDKENFSIMRCVHNIIKQADGGKPNARVPDPDTLEGDVCSKARAAYEKAGTAIVGRGNGFMVPHNANLTSKAFSSRQLREWQPIATRRQRGRMQRDATMQATILGQGGAAIATELLLPIVEILRNEMVTDKLGVTSISGLEGNIVIPRQTAAATAYAVSETGALTLSGQLLDQIPLTPHRVGAFSQYSKQFLLQSSLDVENFIRTDLFAVMALIWDEYIIAGQGAGDQPQGILNQNGVLLVNGTGGFTGYSGDASAVSWADIVNFATQINKVNARRQGRGWCTTSNARGRLETLAKLLVGATTVASVPLWESDVEPMGRINGYPAIDSQQVPSDLLIFGVWANNVIHALWGGLDIVVDPYSLSVNGEVKIVFNTWGDVALRHPQEFCISLNSAAA